MKPIGPLMWEHRLIERVIALMRRELGAIREGGLDLPLIDGALDFFKTYAETLHFGKEESILFASLQKKQMSPELARTMDELVEEHGRLAEQTRRMAALRLSLDSGGRPAEIIGPLETVVELYPSHMEKEDKRFFFPCLDYLSQPEQDRMLAAFQDFDARLLHERYRETVTALEKNRAGIPPRPPAG
ncbi:MAG: hemerythrin domain-containing protein [Chloroflexi bacterium]|nr:hemerythrin domain-containing protein [Chloroflexota bacterium]